MKDQYFGLIAKYALLLTTFFILSFILTRALIEIQLSEDIGENALYRQTAPLIFNIILNLITAYIVGQDIKRLSLKTKYVLLSTVVYRPLGVVAFLLFLLLQNKDKNDND